MELQDIRYFIALGKSLNFTRAAEACGVSQPTLTRAISKMEEELGGLLFYRERSNTHMTALGRLIESHLSQAMAHIGEAKQNVERFLRLEQGQLIVGVMPTIAPAPFVSVIRNFRIDHRGIEVTFAESSADQLCDLLLKGTLDVALLARPDGFPAPFQCIELYVEKFKMACSDMNILSTKSEINVADLDGETLLSRPHCEYNIQLDDLCLKTMVTPRKSYAIDGEHWTLSMVAAGLGVCLVPESTAAYPGVVYRSLVPSSITRRVCLVTVAGRRWSAPVATFVHAIRSHAWSARLPVHDLPLDGGRKANIPLKIVHGSCDLSPVNAGPDGGPSTRIHRHEGEPARRARPCVS